MSPLKYRFSLIIFCGLLALTRSANADEWKHPPDDFLMYRISNLRIEERLQFGLILRSFVFEYERVREGRGTAYVTARNERGIYSLGLTGLEKKLDKSGTYRVPIRRVSVFHNESYWEKSGIEFFLTAAELMNPSRSGKRNYLVSNSLTLGKMGSRVSARSLTPEELKAIEDEKQLRKPPESLPENCQWVSSDISLRPGVPVKHWVRGKWIDATVVEVPRKTHVRLVRSSSKTIDYVKWENWLAISDQTLLRLRSSPDQFSSEARWLPSGRLLLEDDMVPLSKDVTLYPGTPLLADYYYNQWRPCYYKETKGNELVVQFNESSRRTEWSVSSDLIAIRKETLDELKLSSAADRFAENLANLPAGKSDRVSNQRADASAEPEFADFPVLARNSGSTAGATLGLSREWSDSTGRFNLTASLARQTETHVVLEKGDGETVEVAIDRLSQSDRDYLVMRGLDYTSPMQSVGQLQDAGYSIDCCAVSPDKRFLLIGGSSASLYDLSTGKLLVKSPRMPHLGRVAKVGFQPDGKSLYLAGEQGVIDTYAIDRNGKLKQTKQFAGHSKEITSLGITNDSERVFSGDESGSLHWWDFTTGKSLHRLKKLDREVKATHISADGTTLMATSNRTLFVMDSETGNMKREVQLGRSSGGASAFSPNGAVLAFIDGRKIRQWNLLVFQEMEPIETSAYGKSLAIAKDNRHCFVGSRDTIEIWDLESRERVLSQSFGNSASLGGLTLSQDGSLVSCPSGYDSVGIFKVASKK